MKFDDRFDSKIQEKQGDANAYHFMFMKLCEFRKWTLTKF